jgi:hypothetical protein
MDTDGHGLRAGSLAAAIVNRIFGRIVAEELLAGAVLQPGLVRVEGDC